MRSSVILKARSLLARRLNDTSVARSAKSVSGNHLGLSSSSTRKSDVGAEILSRPNHSPTRSAMSFSSKIPSQQRKPNGAIGAENGNSDHPEREYLEAVRELNGLQSNSLVVSLAKYNKPQEILPHVRKQLQLVGIDVQELNRLNAIHVSGTKGKGSTCIFLESILLSNTTRAGPRGERPLRVGCYTSPHLIHVTERIRLNGKPIDRSSFVKYFWHVFNKLKAGTEREHLAMPSYFTFLTILAFYTFLKEQVDCAIIEVGIGGEYDPTNVLLQPVACAITTLDLDHTGILGRTLKSIAWTKAGIIKPNVPMFTVDHEQPEATEMITSRAEQSNSPVYICRPLKISNKQQLGIHGSAQSINASVACELASYLLDRLRSDKQSPPCGPHPNRGPITRDGIDFEELPDSFKQGLKRANFAGRCQVVDGDKVTFFLDGAHTMKSVQNCLDWFLETSSEQAPPDHKFNYMMINIIGERDRCEVLRPLLKHYKMFRKVIFTSNRLDTVSIRDPMVTDNYSRPIRPDHERSLDNARNNAKAWSQLSRDDFSAADCGVEVHATILESIQAILHDFESTIRASGLEGQEIGKPHILATGSLHFVGALLEAIEKLKGCQS